MNQLDNDDIMIKRIDTNVAEFKIIKEDSRIFLSSKGYGRGCFWTEEEEVDWTSSVEEVEEYLYEQYGNRY